jgi:hypothetical protein
MTDRRDPRSRPLNGILAVFFALVGCRTPSSSAGPAQADSGSGAAQAPLSASAAAPETPPDGLAIPKATVEATVNPSHLPAYNGPTGSVEGTVLVRGPEAPDIPNIDVKSCPAALDTYGKLFREGPARADGLRPVPDAVVVVTGYSDYFIPAKGDAERVMIGANCGYAERTIAMTFGQRLEISNSSKIAFAPVLSGAPRAAIMIAPPLLNGDPVKLYPARPGHFMLGDQIQPFVREVVLVLRQPLHAISDGAGHYRIDGVPVGKLKIGTQLEAINSQSEKDLDVRANVVEEVNFELTYAPAASPSGPGVGPGHFKVIP